MILASLHEAALAVGRRFPLTLGARGSATIGGLVSTNAGGTPVLRFGTMRSLVLGHRGGAPRRQPLRGAGGAEEGQSRLRPQALADRRRRTLGLVTAASLELVPAIGERAAAWAGVESPAAAMALLRHLEATPGRGDRSFELVPKSALDLVLAHVPGHAAAARRAGALERARRGGRADGGAGPGAIALRGPESALETGLVADAAIAASEAQAEGFWRLRDSISEAEKKDGPAAKHDISVPVEDMAGFTTAAAAAVEARFPGTSVNAFGHLGDGNVHFNVRAPEGAGAGLARRDRRGGERFVHDLVTQAGGSISAEHGIGQMKLAELARLGDPARLNAMRAIKRALDPEGIMNPGKLVPPFDPISGEPCTKAASLIEGCAEIRGRAARRSRHPMET